MPVVASTSGAPDWSALFEPAAEEILARYKAGRSPTSQLHLIAPETWAEGRSMCMTTRLQAVAETPDQRRICKICWASALRRAREMPEAELEALRTGDHVVNLGTGLVHQVLVTGGVPKIDCQRTPVESYRDRLRRVPDEMVADLPAACICETCTHRGRLRRVRARDPVSYRVGTLVQTEAGVGSYGRRHRLGGHEVKVDGKWVRVATVRVVGP